MSDVWYQIRRRAGAAIAKYRMINPGDRIMVCLSGGKDSAVLLRTLCLLQKRSPVKFELGGAVFHPGFERFNIASIKKQAEECGIKLHITGADIPLIIEDKSAQDHPCMLCSRLRRGALYSLAEKEGYNKLALGHHLDDLAETTLMNLCFRADFETMHPVQPFFDGKLHIIRPLIETRESVVRRLAESYDLPVVKPVCPYDQTNVRARLKPVISELSRIDKLTREHIYNAHDFSSCVLAEKKSGEKEN